MKSKKNKKRENHRSLTAWNASMFGNARVEPSRPRERKAARRFPYSGHELPEIGNYTYSTILCIHTGCRVPCAHKTSHARQEGCVTKTPAIAL